MVFECIQMEGFSCGRSCVLFSFFLSLVGWDFISTKLVIDLFTKRLTLSTGCSKTFFTQVITLGL